MKWLSAGLTFVNVTTICGCLEGIAAHGLNKTVAASSAIAGFVAALIAYWGTSDSSEDEVEEVAVDGVTPVPAPVSVEGQTPQRDSIFDQARRRYKSIWLWAVIAVFAMFAFRSFCNVYFIDGNEYKIQNPNNLGDLSLHVTYIKTFASGVAMWPENPIYVFSKLRYPAGIDLFNAILLCLDISVVRGLVLVGLGASAALCYALFRWGGAFTIAGFLFNGGIVGWQWFRNYEWKDFQSSNYIAWKSLALTMLVTQRGLSPTLAGFSLAAGGGTWALGSWVQSRPGSEPHRQRLTVLGMVLAAAAVAAAPSVLVASVPVWTVAVAWGFGCFGMGLVISSTSVLLLQLSAPEEAGANSAALQISDGLSNVLLLAAGGAAFAALGGGGVAHAATTADGSSHPAAFAAVFLPMAAVALAGAWVATRLHERPA